MGWDFSSEWGSKEDLVAYLTTPSRRGSKTRTIAHSVRNNEVYMVTEFVHDERTCRIIEIYLVSKSDGMWGYKGMDETMYPYYFNCPQKFFKLAPLDMLPTMAEKAKEWREKCKPLKKVPLSKGMTCVLKSSYGGGEFTLTEKLKRGWRGTGVTGIYRILPAMIEHTK